MEVLFEEKFMSLGLHLLLHLPEQVMRFGTTLDSQVWNFCFVILHKFITSRFRKITKGPDLGRDDWTQYKELSGGSVFLSLTHPNDHVITLNNKVIKIRNFLVGNPGGTYYVVGSYYKTQNPAFTLRLHFSSDQLGLFKVEHLDEVCSLFKLNEIQPTKCIVHPVPQLADEPPSHTKFVYPLLSL